MWWRNATIYEEYVRSFADSNGDGVGDIPGIVSRLDYLQWLGVDALWLTPIMVSPGRDHGYDVADYLDVDPAFGTLSDLDKLIWRGWATQYPDSARPGPQPHKQRASLVP